MVVPFGVSVTDAGPGPVGRFAVDANVTVPAKLLTLVTVMSTLSPRLCVTVMLLGVTWIAKSEVDERVAILP